MKKLLSIVLLSVLFSASASGSIIYGSGTASCGKWVQERNKDSSAAVVYMSWVLGFVSAIDATEKWSLKATDSAAMSVFIDNYCQANPLKKISEATVSLVIELQE